MTASDEASDRYRLGGRERRGLLAGWRGGQIGSVAAGLAFSVAVLRMLPGAAGFVAAATFTLAGIAGACWPVRGRTIDEWAPALVRHAALAATAERRWRDAAPWQRRPARSAFEGLEIGQIGGAGVVFDRVAGTCSAAISLTGSGFALLGWEERRDRVVAWSRLLAALARDGTGVHRLQWIERTLPDDGAALREHFSAQSAATPAGRSYSELLEAAGRAGVRHDLHVVVTVRQPRRGPASEAHDRLAREVASLERALRHAGAVVHGILGPDELSALVASALDAGPAPGRGPWPIAYDVEWDHLRADALFHVTYWVSEWPRTDVGSDFLVPFVAGGAGLRRTFAVTLAPVAPLRASRQAEQARTSGVADAELRRRHGFAVTARARRDHDAVLQREAELAAGHASYRFSAYVTVSAPDAEQLERSCEAVEQLAAASQLDLRRLYGAQDAGFLATLPLGRGLS